MASLGRYRRTEVQVGVFAVLCVAALVLGLLWLRDFRFAKRYNIYKAEFTDTGGLVPGDIVMVSGFRKGSVRSMKLLERGVEAELAIEEDVVLRADAVAVIGSKGLLGERFVSLERGTSIERLGEGGRLHGRLEYGMAELMSGAGELLEATKLASEDVRRVLQTLANATQDTELQRGVRDASVAATHVRQILEGNHTALERSIQNFERATGDLAKLTDESRGDVQALLRDLRSASARLDGLMSRIDSTTVKADRVADRVLKADGTVARLLDDPKLYQDLVRLTARADSLVTEIREHPRRFFELSIF